MLDVSEVRLNGMLIGYARGELSDLQMKEVSILLSKDLSLGEELERIYIALEEKGEEFSG